MRSFKPLLLLIGVLAAPLTATPALAAAPEPFTLGAPAPVASSLSEAVPPVAGPATKGKATAKSAQPAGKTAASVKAKPAAKASAKGARPVASKSKSRNSADVIATDVPSAKLDLSLPRDMVNQLQPPGKEASPAPVVAHPAQEGKPLLPALFSSKEGAEPFELNGRLLSNEMELQLRNESRKEVDGAALEFKFKQ